MPDTNKGKMIFLKGKYPAIGEPGKEPDPLWDLQIGDRVFIDRTPVTGTIVEILVNKKGKADRYKIMPSGKWRKPIIRKADSISKTEYDTESYPGKWDLNPNGRNTGAVISFMGITPKPGAYETVNPHNCPAHTKITVEIYPKGGVQTYCPGCGESPVVFYEMGEFNFVNATFINPVHKTYSTGPRPCPKCGRMSAWDWRAGGWKCPTHKYFFLKGGPTLDNPIPPVPCRCCGQLVYNFDNYPIHTKCIPKHWGQHAKGINAGRCREFGYKSKKRNPEDPDNVLITSTKRYCDICAQQGIPNNLAWYDGRTKMGPWANMCEAHFKMYGVGLGTGKGQMYQYQSKEVAAAPPIHDTPVKPGEKIYVIRGGQLRVLKEGVVWSEYLAKHPDAYRCTKPPTMATMEKWVEEDSGIVRATDGCKVEPDGTCPHGKPSWLRFYGYI